MASNRVYVKGVIKYMYNYAQLDEQGFCVGLSSLSGKIENTNAILINEYDLSYIGRRYDRVLNEWLDEYIEPIEEVTTNEFELLIKETYETTQVVSDDNLINMELICALDEKLTLIMEHLGLNG